MRLFLLHLILALAWMLISASFNLYTLLAGLVMGYLLLALFGRTLGDPHYHVKLWYLVRFLGYFVRILIVANWQVAKLVLDPAMPIHPRIIRYDVTGLTPGQLTTLANAITLTPGTLAVDVSPDQRLLYIHCLNAPDRDRAVSAIDELKQRLMTEVLG